MILAAEWHPAAVVVLEVVLRDSGTSAVVVVDHGVAITRRANFALSHFVRGEVRFRAKLGPGGAKLVDCIGVFRHSPPLGVPGRRVFLRGSVSLRAKYPRTRRRQRERLTAGKLFQHTPNCQGTIWRIAIMDKCTKSRVESQSIFLCHAMPE